MLKIVFVALADGFEEVEAMAPIDVLRRAGFDLVTVGITGQTVKSSRNVVVIPDKQWNDVAEMTPDLLVLPGGMPGSKHLGEHAGLKKMAERIAQADGYLAAICAAPAFTLATWGLLSGHRATCYPGYESQFPKDVTGVTDKVVVDRHIITSMGAGCAFDFSFALVEQFSGKTAVQKLKEQMMFPM